MPHQLPPIDDDVFEALQKLAEPLVDDANSVLRRLLGLSTDAVRVTPTIPTSVKARKKPALPDAAFEPPVLAALVELGGRAPAAEVIDHVGRLLAPQLTDVDREELKSGEIRWRNRVQFARLRLVRSGHLSKQSPRGTWELSELGRRTANTQIETKERA